MHPKLPFLFIPYVRLELPGWGKLLDLTKVRGDKNDPYWHNAPTKTIKGKWHGYSMQLRLSDWSERMTYFLGRYYELGVQYLLDAVLEPGDRVVDIGGNIGMITLHAAHLVTENGEVDCFEPNPECVAIIDSNLKRNQIKQVTIHPFGLSDRKDLLKLNLASHHTGSATMTSVSTIQKYFEVEVFIGDDVLLANPKNIKLIKIDVEGFELHVLQGLTKTLNKFKPLLITEFLEKTLVRAGTNCKEVGKFLLDLGYVPYGITTERKLLQYHLKLVPLDKTLNGNQFNDIFWVHKKNSFKDKIYQYIK